jgi:hypothetical protein
MGLLASIAVFCSTPLGAQEQVYEIARLEARLELRADGAYHIREAITYDFQEGSFTFAYRDIPLANSDGVSLVTVESADVAIGNVEQEEELSSWRVRWEFPPTSGAVTFVLEYEILGAVREVDETNEVFWRVVGSGWDVPFRQVEAEVVIPSTLSVLASDLTLDPPDIASVRAEEDGLVARFLPGALPAGRAYQLKVSFPKVMAGRPVGLARPEAQAALAGFLSFGLFLLVGGVIAFNRRGIRFPPRRRIHPGTDIPEAAVLLHRASPGWDRAFPATLFDLAERDAISLERVDRKKLLFTEQRVILRRNHESDEALTPFEEDFLVELGKYEDLKDFGSKGKKFRKAAMERVREGLIASGQLVDARGSASRALLVALAVAVPALVLFVAGAVMGRPWLMALGGAGLGVGGGLALVGSVRFSTSRPGAEKVAELKGYLEGVREEIKQKTRMSPLEAARRFFSALPWLTLDPKYTGGQSRKIAKALKKETGELRTPAWALDRTRKFQKAAADMSAAGAYVAFLPVTNITTDTCGATAPWAGAGVGGAAGAGAAGGGGGGAG